MTRTELIEHMAWKLRDVSGSIDRPALDLLSELDRSEKWRSVADRAGSAPADAWSKFLRELAARIREIR